MRAGLRLVLERGACTLLHPKLSLKLSLVESGCGFPSSVLSNNSLCFLFLF